MDIRKEGREIGRYVEAYQRSRLRRWLRKLGVEHSDNFLGLDKHELTEEVLRAGGDPDVLCEQYRRDAIDAKWGRDPGDDEDDSEVFRTPVSLKFTGPEGNTVALVKACTDAARYSDGWTFEMSRSFFRECISYDRRHALRVIFEHFRVLKPVITYSDVGIDEAE